MGYRVQGLRFRAQGRKSGAVAHCSVPIVSMMETPVRCMKLFGCHWHGSLACFHTTCLQSGGLLCQLRPVCVCVGVVASGWGGKGRRGERARGKGERGFMVGRVASFANYILTFYLSLTDLLPFMSYTIMPLSSSKA